MPPPLLIYKASKKFILLKYLWQSFYARLISTSDYTSIYTFPAWQKSKFMTILNHFFFNPAFRSQAEKLPSLLSRSISVYLCCLELVCHKYSPTRVHDCPQLPQFHMEFLKIVRPSVYDVTIWVRSSAKTNDVINNGLNHL